MSLINVLGVLCVINVEEETKRAIVDQRSKEFSTSS